MVIDPEPDRFTFRLTAASPGFMGKSQMIEFVREIEKLFHPRSSSNQVKSGRRRTLQSIEWVDDARTISSAVVDRAFYDDSLITFEMFHRSITKLGFSCSRPHSRLIWALFCSEAYGGVRQFLPAGDVSNYTIRLFLQPIASGGKFWETRSSDS